VLCAVSSKTVKPQSLAIFGFEKPHTTTHGSHDEGIRRTTAYAAHERVRHDEIVREEFHASQHIYNGRMTGIIPTLAQADELHRTIAPSQAAYDLIHTHCVIIATITRQLVHRQNALFVRRCTLPADAAELGGRQPASSAAPMSGSATVLAHSAQSLQSAQSMQLTGSEHSAQQTQPTGPASQSTQSADRDAADDNGVAVPAVPPTDGVSGGTVPPYLLDEKLAVLGAMLHDIGTYKVLKDDGSDGGALSFDGPRYILHGLLGYEYLLEQGVDESVAQFARNHTGVGLTSAQVKAQHLPLPDGDYVPMTLEQEVVMVADKYHSKSIPPKFLTAEAYAAKAGRYGEANKRQWLELVAKYGTPDIPALAKRFGMRLVQ
jgi:uncharacterized protein